MNLQGGRTPRKRWDTSVFWEDDDFSWNLKGIRNALWIREIQRRRERVTKDILSTRRTTENIKSRMRQLMKSFDLGIS